MKRWLLLILAFTIFVLPVNAKAKDTVKVNAKMATEFDIQNNFKDIITFKPNRTVKINEKITIPSMSVVTAEVLRFQKERRMHKHGFILCRVISYTPPNSEEAVNLLEDEVYFVARKYSSINEIDAAMTGGE